MSMHNLIEFGDNYSKTSGTLWQYCGDKLALVANAITDFTVANATTDSLKIIEEMVRKTGNDGTKNVKIMVPLKYLSNFWIIFEMLIINCEVNLDLNWPKKCVTVATDVADQDAQFLITDAKLCVPDNLKLFEKVKPGFKRTINWNKYLSEISTEGLN